MGAPSSKALTAAAVALLLLAGCGGGPSTQTPGAPSASAPAAPSTSAAAATPTATPRTEPSDETTTVKDASETFVDTALTLSYAEGVGPAYAGRVKPLMTGRGYSELSALASKAVGPARSRFGKKARSKPQILGGTKVDTLSADRATTTVNFKPRVQQLTDGKWKTIKAAVVDETAKLTLVKEGDRWLVDKME